MDFWTGAVKTFRSAHHLPYGEDPHEESRMPSPPPRPPRNTLPLELHGALRKLGGALMRGRRPAPPAAPCEEGCLTVASYNIHKCVGVDNRFDPGRIAAVIAELEADVVALQEVDRRFGQRTGLLNAAALERRTGLTMLHVSDTPGGHGWHGNAILVRQARLIRLRRMHLPGAEARGALVAELQLPAGRVRVVAAHLGLLRRHRAMQAEALLEAIRHGSPMPTLLMGDLNEWRPGIPSSLVPLESLFGPLDPGEPSFPSRLPFLALDRILAHPRAMLAGVEAHASPLARLASDHLPLRARIDLRRAVAPAWAAAA
jgi:endonuclease/exonuclease/phosphatase family metal-dependent hydrolase